MLNPNLYGDEIASILNSCENGERLLPLAPSGTVKLEGLKRLRLLTSQDLFGEKPVVAGDYAECVHSALFLYFSALDESHTISQGVPTATGSYLHGIMHRQEPDFSNAKYWFRRVGDHDIFPLLREGVLNEILTANGDNAAARQLRGYIQSLAQWDPFWFIDQCEAAVRGNDARLERLVQEMQRLEWQLLFDHCFRRAIGES